MSGAVLLPLPHCRRRSPAPRHSDLAAAHAPCEANNPRHGRCAIVAMVLNTGLHCRGYNLLKLGLHHAGSGRRLRQDRAWSRLT